MVGIPSMQKRKTSNSWSRSRGNISNKRGSLNPEFFKKTGSQLDQNDGIYIATKEYKKKASNSTTKWPSQKLAKEVLLTPSPKSSDVILNANGIYTI